MPQEALPIPPSPINNTLVRLHREYFDLLQRPMTGKVTITGSQATRGGVRNVLPEPVTVSLVDGVIDLMVPADTYTIEADLWSVDDTHSTDTEQVTLRRRGEPSEGGG